MVKYRTGKACKLDSSCLRDFFCPLLGCRLKHYDRKRVSRTSELSLLKTAASARKDFHVAIVGAGMCGLAAAYALTRANISVKVFESAVRQLFGISLI